MERSSLERFSATPVAERPAEWWEELALYCKEAADSFSSFHPDANFFRLAQQIAEEQAGLRKRPAGLMPLPSGCDDSRSL